MCSLIRNGEHNAEAWKKQNLNERPARENRYKMNAFWCETSTCEYTGALRVSQK